MKYLHTSGEAQFGYCRPEQGTRRGKTHPNQDNKTFTFHYASQHTKTSRKNRNYKLNEYFEIYLIRQINTT